MKELHPQGMIRPRNNGQEWNRPQPLGDGEAQPALRHKQHLADQHGHVTGSSHTGMVNATPPKDWSRSSYHDRSLAGGKELGHNHRQDVTDREAAQMHGNFIDNATFGRGNDFEYGERFNVASNGIQRIDAKRQGQVILSPTSQNNVGRMFGFPESSIRQPMHNGGNLIKPTGDGPIRVNESAVSGGDDDDYGWRRHED